MADLRILLDTYNGVLGEHLTPSAIIPHLAPWLDDETIEATVHTAERRDRREACRILLSALKKSSSRGILRGFLDALRAAEFSYLADMLEGHTSVHDEAIFRNLLKIFYPVLYQDVDPAEIIPSLVESQCITREDEERLLAVQHTNGRPVAILSLLTTVVTRQPNWFPCLMVAMKNGGCEHIVQQIEPKMLAARNMEDAEKMAEKLKESNTSPAHGDERYAKYQASRLSPCHEYQPLEHSLSCPSDLSEAQVGLGDSTPANFRRPPDRSRSVEPSSTAQVPPEQPTSVHLDHKSADPGHTVDCTEEWFHGDLSRENSRKLIIDYGSKKGDGTFLVRRSTSLDHPYTLVLYMKEQDYHVPISYSRQGGGQLVLGQEIERKKVYPCLRHLVNDYKRRGISLATLEGQPLEGTVYLQSSPPKTVAPLYDNLR